MFKNPIAYKTKQNKKKIWTCHINILSSAEETDMHSNLIS